MTAPMLCSGCGKALSPHPNRKGPRCRSCQIRFLATDPEVRARAVTAIREAMKDADMLRRRGRKCSASRKLRMKTDPAFAAREIEKARRLGLSGAGVQRHGPGSAARVKAGKTLSKRRRKGIPAGYWDEYRRLVKIKEVPAIEARRLVQEQAERDRKARIRAEKAKQREDAMSAEDRIRLATRRLGAACGRLATKEARR